MLSFNSHRKRCAPTLTGGKFSHTIVLRIPIRPLAQTSGDELDRSTRRFPPKPVFSTAVARPTKQQASSDGSEEEEQQQLLIEPVNEEELEAVARSPSSADEDGAAAAADEPDENGEAEEI
ncbi:hypothetical protein NL676_012332 [Syzygium grande]|nr:hypothetical protein NL676_012332 [Syzygium grande]